MQIEPVISFKGLDSSDAIKEVILKRIERLEQFHNRLTSCRVTVEMPNKFGNNARVYEVHVDITYPGGEIYSARDRKRNHAHEDVHLAIRDSFNAAERQLEDASRKMSGHMVKPEPMKLHGTVDRLVPEEGFGFIKTAEGREYFFRRESLTSPELWEALAPGSEVRFTEHNGEKGPFASAVTTV